MWEFPGLNFAWKKILNSKYSIKDWNSCCLYQKQSKLTGIYIIYATIILGIPIFHYPISSLPLRPNSGTFLEVLKEIVSTLSLFPFLWRCANF